LHRLELPSDKGIRIDSGYRGGDTVSVHYDPMLAKIIAWGPDRPTANRRLQRALATAWAPGVATNLPLLREVVAHPAWQAADLDTGFLSRHGMPTAPPLNLDEGAIAATVLSFVRRQETAPPGPPAFRVGGPAEQSDTWVCGDQEVEVHWTALGDRLSLRIGDRGIEAVVHGTDGSHWDLEVDGERRTWRLVATPERDGPPVDGDVVYVHTGLGEAFVALKPRFPDLEVQSAEPGTAVAPTPATVAAVHVAVSDEVEAGDRLVTLEAMKMEHPVNAGQAGVVAAVCVEVGETVEAGATLVRVDPIG
jgi:propionyl-CoA carboxylase alpha chain